MGRRVATLFRHALRFVLVGVVSCGGRILQDAAEGGQPDGMYGVDARADAPSSGAGTVDSSLDSLAAADSEFVDSSAIDSPTDSTAAEDRVASDAGACAQAMDCVGCCQSLFATGNTTYFQDVQDCVCGAGPCQTACADEYCATYAVIAGDPCDTCIGTAVGSGGVCSTSTTEACLADAQCATYLECANACP